MRSTSRPWPVKSTVRLTRRPRRRPGSLSRRALGRWASATRCSLGGAVQVQRAVAARDEPGLGEPRQGVRDRRSLGADEPAEQPVRERERETDAAGLDPAPAPGQVPEQQREPHLEARLRGDRALDVEVGGARTRAGEQGVRDLRPRLDALGERVVEQGEARGTSACQVELRSSRSSARAASGCRTSPSPTISVAVRSPTRTSTLSTPSTIEHAGPVADLRRSSARGRSRRPARRRRRRSRPAGPRAACAGRAARPDRRRGRAGSGRTRSAARRCSTARAAPATAPCPALKMAVEQRCGPRQLVERAVPPGASRRCTVILRLVYPARKAGNHDYPGVRRAGLVTAITSALSAACRPLIERFRPTEQHRSRGARHPSPERHGAYVLGDPRPGDRARR